MLYSTATLLADSNIIESDDLNSLSQFILTHTGENIDLHNLYRKLKVDHISLNFPETIEKIKSRLLTSLLSANYDKQGRLLSNQIKNRLKQLLSFIIDDYLEVNNFLYFYRLMENYAGKRDIDNIRFLESVLVSNDVFRRMGINQQKLSKLLFGDENFIKDSFTRDLISHTSSILRIITTSLKWDSSSFNGLLSDNEIKDLRSKIIDLVSVFVFSASGYLADTVPRFGLFHNKEFLREEWDLIQSIWVSASIFSQEFKIQNPLIKELFNIKVDLTSKLKISRARFNIGTSTLKQILDALYGFIGQEMSSPSPEGFLRIEYYFDTISQVKKYASNRYLGLSVDRSILRGRDRLWNKDYIVAYHIITLLVRDLGFDPITFQPLDPLIFEDGTFARHHIDSLEKALLWVTRLLLTDDSKHSAIYYSLARDPKGVKEIEILLKKFQELINTDGSGPNGRLEEIDVRRIMGGVTVNGRPIIDWWINDNGKSFKDYLAIFNDRRNLVRAGDITGFISTDYEPAFIRFYSAALHTLNAYYSILGETTTYDITRLFSDEDLKLLGRIFSF
ncbi:hypothetical protein LCGC14_0982710 [marine sediment metagenome]|uniref:Uncharacterized protein n=1 Tax=marine sediment metagenome TaxID=412755 RepID=A0A0F9NUM1_9ZZZZ